MTIQIEGSVWSASVHPADSANNVRSGSRRFVQSALAKRVCRAAGFAIIVGASILSIGAGNLFAQQGDQGVAALKQSGQYDNLRSAFVQAQHKVEPKGSGFRLQNPENQLQAEFHDGAVTAKHPGGEFGLRLEGYGYGARLASPATASAHASGTRVEYQRGALTEWYVNDVRGLEQGFTLRERPAHQNGGPLEIELSVSGNLRPALVGDHVELRRNGRAVLQYTGLKAWDVKGRALSGQMAARDGRIRLFVNDRDAAYPITVDPWVQQQEIADPGATAGDRFGASVSVNGTTAVVGAPAGNGNLGAAYVFTLSGGTWTQQQELTAGDGASGDQFGASVALNGTLIVVGAPGRNTNTGAAYVFVSFLGFSSQQAELTASDAASSANFGSSVAVNGTTALIGSYNFNGGQGSAYVFLQSGTTWSQQAELLASDKAAGDNFGTSVALSGNIAIIGAPQKTVTKTNQGVAYAFTRSVATWTQQTPDLVAKAPAAAAVGDNFGSSVSLDIVSSVPTALIAAPQRTSAKGVVYVFTSTATGATWTQQTTLTAGDAAAGDLFGTSVSLSGTAAVIGAPDHGSNNNDRGAAYEFTGSGSTWTQQATDLLASDAAKNDLFGASVSVSGTLAVIGATGHGKGGTSYMFDLTPWTFTSANSTTFTVGTAGTFAVTVTGSPAPALSVNGALPAGVTFADNGGGSGTFSGTPQAGTGDAYTITITASGAGNSATQTFTLTVDEPPTINSSNAVTFTVGTLSTFQVTTGAPGAPGFPLPTFSVTGSLPSGVTFTAGGTLSGTPAAGTGNVYPLTITASNGVSPNSTQSFTLTVDEPPTINSASSTTFTAGTAGSFQVTTSPVGYPVPVISETTGAGNTGLPSGVTLADNANGAGTLSGTPAAGTGGIWTFNVNAKNGITPNAKQLFTLTVNEAPGITSNKKTTFTVGQPGTFTVKTSGYPNPALSENGSLPTGVTFTDNGNGTATLAGNPVATTGGTYTFTITANNGVSPNATQNFTLTVDEAPSITSANNATVKVGNALSFTVTASGNPASTFSTSSALPNGITLSPSGALSGTPAVGTGGLYPITIAATNGVAPDASQAFTLTVNEPPTITSANNTTFTAGTMGTFPVTASGYPTSTFTETGSLPSGVTLASNGTLSGTPAAGTGGTYPITITAANKITPKATQAFTLTVDEAPTVTSASKTTFTVGTAGSFTVKASGYPTTFTFSTGSALPNGVTLSPSGSLSGTPAAGTGGSYPILINVSNGISPDGTQNFTLTVDQAPAFTSANNTTFTVGSLGSFNVTASGYPAPTFTETGALPSGVTLSSAGLLSGTPAVGTGGVYSITITAKNGTTPNATQSFTLTVDEAPSITSVNYAGFAVGMAGSFTVTTLGYPKPSITENGPLPNGLGFTDNGDGTGTLSGTPLVLVGGNFGISFTAQNGIGSPATQLFTIILGQAPVITSAGTAAFTYGAPNSFTVTAAGFPTPSLSEIGTLPAGVTFVDNGNGTGTLSGTPVAAGNYNITFAATNVVTTTTQPFVLSVAGLSFTPANLNFYTVYLNTSNSATLTVKNLDAFTVNITGMSITPGTADAASYSFVNHCPAALKPNASCTITVMFTPDTVGALTATLNVTDNAPGSPQQIALSGISINPVAQFDQSSLAFGTQAVGSSTTMIVNLTNPGLTPLIISSIGITGANSSEFSEVDDCPITPQTLPSTMGCTISVTFAPTVKGARTGTLTVTDNVQAGKSTLGISGTGH